ncbi:unnamed protein product [Paramecium sonneborni]|uniref:Uncharacterized protein n=1 Tax=Paramecium sonneborni TaxID=65129 RepID=A0A8S1PQW3_9CILI|nr:unnamed protein product [Paramecium sonneborni]
MGSAVVTLQKNIFEQASLFRNRKTFLNEKQKQTNNLLRLYFLSTFAVLLTQLAIMQQENVIFQMYADYRKKIEQERKFVRETL